MGECGGSETDVYAYLAYVGGFMLAVGPAWQTFKMWKKKHTKDISMKWSINYVIGLTLTTIFSAVNGLWPILIGEVLELINMLILITYKINIEKQFLRFKWGNDKPEVVEITTKDFKEVATKNEIVLSIEHEDLHDILEKSNDDDNVFLMTLKRADIENMLSQMDKASDDKIDMEKIIELHDSDNESDSVIRQISTI